MYVVIYVNLVTIDDNKTAPHQRLFSRDVVWCCCQVYRFVPTKLKYFAQHTTSTNLEYVLTCHREWHPRIKQAARNNMVPQSLCVLTLGMLPCPSIGGGGDC